MMNEIDRLKHEEQALMDDDLYAEDYVQTLKIEESELEDEQPQRSPQRWERPRNIQRHRKGWLPFLGIIALIWIMSAGAVGNLWALLLLFPAIKNWQRVREDQQLGNVTRQTRKALRGTMLALLFMFMFIFNAWGAFFPLLLIGLGISALYGNRLQNDVVYY